MSVASNTTLLEQQLVAFRRDRDAILGNAGYSQQGKLDGVERLLGERATSAEQVCLRLWGALQPVTPPPVDEPGTVSRRTLIITQTMDSVLDPTGEAWQELGAAERNLAAAKEAAERDGIDPAWLAMHQARISTMLRKAMDDVQPWKAFEQAYESAAAETKLAVQNFAAAMLPHGREWNLFALRLEKDREARVHTPAVQAAEKAGADLVDLLVERSVPATQAIAAEMGRASLYLERVPRGILVKREPYSNGTARTRSNYMDVPTWKISVHRVEFKANGVAFP